MFYVMGLKLDGFRKCRSSVFGSEMCYVGLCLLQLDEFGYVRFVAYVGLSFVLASVCIEAEWVSFVYFSP